MFLSKIWFFLITVVAALALCAALVMPRPAERQVLEAESERLARARWGVEMLLRDNARVWIDLASGFARAPAPAGQPRLKLDEVLEAASNDETISDASHATARDTLQYILAQVSGSQKPEFVVALDKWGRVVAGVGDDLYRKGENLGGYFVVEDALRGYLRDDLWYEGNQMYRIAAAPVIDRTRGEYVGALVLGDEVDLTLAKDLEDRVGAHVAFFVGGDTVAVSVADHAITKDIQAAYEEKKAALDEKDEEGRPVTMAPFAVQAGSSAYEVALRRLPGEVAAREAYFAVFAEKPRALGFMGTLRGVTKDDVALGKFPWIWVGLGLIGVLALGIFLMISESDRPLRQLVLSSVKLGRGEVERLPEEQKGKFGSVARSVNIALERLERDARMTPKGRDLGAVLGPPPEVASAAPPPMPPQFRPSGAPFEFPGERKADLPPPPPPLDLPPPRRTQSMSTPPPVALGPGPRSTVGMPARSGAGGGGMRGMSLEEAQPDELEFVSNAHTGANREIDPFAPPPPGAGPAQRARRKTGSLALQPAVSDDELLASTADLSAVTGKSGASAGRAGGGGLDSDFGGETVIRAPEEKLLREASSGMPSAVPEEAAGFEKVYREFMTLKERCGEPTEGLTLEKFSEKLRKNRDQLVQKYACKAVKFQVYVKDGKAALKATPIKS